MKDKKIGKLFKLKDEQDKDILPEYIYPIKSTTDQYEVLIVVDDSINMIVGQPPYEGDRLMVARPAMSKYYQVVEDS